MLEQANKKYQRQISGSDGRNSRTPCSRECMNTSQAQRPDRFEEGVRSNEDYVLAEEMRWLVASLCRAKLVIRSRER